MPDVLDEAIAIVEAHSVRLTEPDRWGHWYRGNITEKRTLVKASQDRARERREENKRLAWLMNPWTPEMCMGRTRTERSLNYLRSKFYGRIDG